MKYVNNGKSYQVESITCEGMCIQVNGTTITNCDLQAEIFGYEWYKPCGDFSVFANSDEIVFHSFEKAYDFAMNSQKDTFLNEYELAAYERKENEDLGIPLFMVSFDDLRLAREVADKLVDKWTITITDKKTCLECY